MHVFVLIGNLVASFYMNFSSFFSVKALGNIPPMWLIAIVAGLPIFSETMYTPSLPHIATTLCVEEVWVEYTLAIYFFGTAIGTIFWGHFSDYFGRKPALLIGFSLYALSCLACSSAMHINTLLMARLSQALGGSVGTVLGQAISHDVFKGKKRGQVFSTIGAILALAPAIGPVIGGFLDQTVGWRAIFITLMLWGTFLVVLLFFRMPETHPPEKRGIPPTLKLLKRMWKDPKILTCGAIVGLSNGLTFSFNAEGPFYLISILGLSPLMYGFCFTAFALMSSLGSYISRILHNRLETSLILRKGVYVLAISASVFGIGTLILWAVGASRISYLLLSIFSMSFVAMGRGLSIANCLSLALENYARVAGTATSLFVCFYYIIISAATTLMANLHDDTLIPMPLYFMALALVMLGVSFLVPPSEASLTEKSDP